MQLSLSPLHLRSRLVAQLSLSLSGVNVKRLLERVALAVLTKLGRELATDNYYPGF